MKHYPIALLVASFLSLSSNAQTNDSPENAYQWKTKRKTELQPGYVVLRSGKKLAGQISLNGYYSAVEEIDFVGEGKEITFPAGALLAYGVNAKEAANSETTKNGVTNDSPEELYEWMNGGVVMDKVVTNSKPRAGYVVTKKGKRVEGELKVQRRDDELWKVTIKKGKDRLKFKPEEISNYGLSVSAEEIKQANLSEVEIKYFDGTVMAEQEITGKIGLIGTGFKKEKIILKTEDGSLTEFTPQEAKSFTITVEGQPQNYITVDGLYIFEEYSGNTFQVYRNPNPTTVDAFATALVKRGVEAGATIAASEMSKADQRKQGYDSNMDSIILYSSKEDLIKMRQKLLDINGFATVDELNERSNNESLKNNVNAIEIAIAGREFAETDESIYNKEWIIHNKKTGEKKVVYKSDYSEQISDLLYGCYDYLSLEKSAQKEHQKWKNFLGTVKYLDGCY